MGKTITTFLIDGTPTGPQYATINNRPCKLFIVPRACLSIIKDREELNNPAFYILLGEDEKLKPKAYLGETETFRTRVKDHDHKREFWEKALIFIAKDSEITKADVQYLEHLAVALAKKSENYNIDENIQTPKEPNLPEHQKYTMNDFFEDIKFLTSFVGCNIFNIVDKKNVHLFFINSRGSEAKGFYTQEGFTVLKGSVFSSNTSPYFRNNKGREEFLKTYAKKENDKIILSKDYTFSSPSAAASFVTGQSENGWTTWEDKEQQTLDSIYRNLLI